MVISIDLCKIKNYEDLETYRKTKINLYEKIGNNTSFNFQISVFYLNFFFEKHFPNYPSIKNINLLAAFVYLKAQKKQFLEVKMKDISQIFECSLEQLNVFANKV
jgi:hypothetical protein